jgi:hypothetical protein
MGDMRSADSIMHEIKLVCSVDCVSDYKYAQLYSLNNQPETALRYLNRCYENTFPLLLWMRIEPNFDPIRNLDGFKELERKVFK